ncbi:MAG: hypothetical protein R3F61_06405 [Myxococcota bacterium]
MILALLAPAFAESWCAGPLVAHEWGVTVLAPQGGTVNTPSTPGWFHHTGASVPDGPAVRTLPPDTGIRDLPVVHFYAKDGWTDHIPLGFEVGFGRGEATSWFPAVSERTPGATANSAAAHLARKALLERRAALTPHVERADPGADLTRQLHWNRLILTQDPLAPAQDTSSPWVARARGVSEALWVNGPGESDRFLFYDAETRESPALVVERGDSGKPDHLILRNTSDWDVHDVMFVHDGRVWTAPRIPAGKTAGFLLRDVYDPVVARSWLDDRWHDTAGVPTTDWEQCVMMRDPALPLESAGGHRMFRDELDVLWEAWGDALVEGSGTRLVYREDTAALDAVMPISMYTDMFHDPRLHRLGVVLVQSPPLP